MLKSSRIKCKKLKKYAKSGDESGIQKTWIPRVRRILNALDVATHYAEIDIQGYDWHELKGNRKGTYSVSITGNWRITYRWDNDGPYQVDLEDYHGR